MSLAQKLSDVISLWTGGRLSAPTCAALCVSYPFRVSADDIVDQVFRCFPSIGEMRLRQEIVQSRLGLVLWILESTTNETCGERSDCLQDVTTLARQMVSLHESQKSNFFDSVALTEYCATIDEVKSAHPKKFAVDGQIGRCCAPLWSHLCKRLGVDRTASEKCLVMYAAGMLEVASRTVGAIRT
jgi:hypothetical protein